MDTLRNAPDPKLDAAVNELVDEIKRNVHLAKQARADFATSARAFFAPTLRVLGYVALMVLLVVGELERQRRASE